MVKRSAEGWHRFGCDCQRQKQWTQWDGPEGDNYFTTRVAYIEHRNNSRVQQPPSPQSLRDSSPQAEEQL